KSQGGLTTAGNIVAAHAYCNNKRQNGEPQEKVVETPFDEMLRLLRSLDQRIWSGQRPASPPLCIDCRWATIAPEQKKHFRYSAVCSHPSSAWEEIDRVAGERSSVVLHCYKARWAVPARCGPAGQHWEPK